MSGIQSVTNSPYQTQSTSSSSTTPAPQNPFLDPNGPFANLNLTPTQQQQLQQIFSQNSGTQQSPSQVIDQIEAVLTPQQQQTLQNDLQTLHSHHHHHGGSSSSDPLAQLNLTSTQQSQISQILQSAKASGTSSSDVLTQIENVLTPSQQQQLASLFSSYTSSGSTGSTGSPSQPYVINTTA